MFRGRPLHRNFSSHREFSFPVKEQFLSQLLEKLMQFREKACSALCGARPHAGNLGCLFFETAGVRASGGFYLIPLNLPLFSRVPTSCFWQFLLIPHPVFVEKWALKVPTLTLLLMPYLFILTFEVRHWKFFVFFFFFLRLFFYFLYLLLYVF